MEIFTTVLSLYINVGSNVTIKATTKYLDMYCANHPTQKTVIIIMKATD